MADGIAAGIGQFNIESEEEGLELAAIAEQTGQLGAGCALRVNPDVDAGTHEKISTGKAENKFGVPIHRAGEIFARLAGRPGLNLRGVAVHIGSQLSDLAPMETAFAKLGDLIAELRGAGHTISHADLGGGLGVPYKAGEVMPSPADYGAMVARVTRGWDVRLMFEPGRVISGNAGVLLTRVVRVKRGGNGDPFVIVDAAMNDLARPALYGAWHDFEAVCAERRADDRQCRRPDLRDRRYLRHGPRHRRARSRRTGRVPHCRGLWRDHGKLLQFARLRARSDGRWRRAGRSSPTASSLPRSSPPRPCRTGWTSAR